MTEDQDVSAKRNFSNVDFNDDPPWVSYLIAGILAVILLALFGAEIYAAATP